VDLQETNKTCLG